MKKIMAVISMLGMMSVVAMANDHAEVDAHADAAAVHGTAPAPHAKVSRARRDVAARKAKRAAHGATHKAAATHEAPAAEAPAAHDAHTPSH